MKKRIEVIMAVVLLIGAYFFAREGAHMVENMRAQKGEICIVVDAGHGGDDPGKIGINKEKEKDINLKIARKLKKMLEKENIKIVMLKRKINIKELAARLGTTGNNMTNKFKRDNFSENELNEIAHSPSFMVQCLQFNEVLVFHLGRAFL